MKKVIIILIITNFAKLEYVNSIAGTNVNTNY